MFKKYTISFMLFLLSTLAMSQNLLLDNSYGNRGEFTIPSFPNQSDGSLNAHYILKNKSIIAAYKMKQVRSKYGFMLFKTKPNGQTDSSFGTNGVNFFIQNQDSTLITQTIVNQVISVTENNNRDIYALLNLNNGSVGIVKMRENGSTDSTFGTDGIIDFKIKDSTTIAANISIENGNIYISGHFTENNRQKCFVKSYDLNGQINLLKSNLTHLEIDNTSSKGIHLSSHLIDLPNIYLYGSSIETNLSEFLIIKSHLTDPHVNNIESSLVINNWNLHAVKQLKIVDNDLYFIGNFSRNSNKNHSALIAKLNKNLKFDNSFNQNGILATPIYSDGVYYADFEIVNDKIYIFGQRRSNNVNPIIETKNFVCCITRNGSELNSFGVNSFFYFNTFESNGILAVPNRMVSSADSLFLLTFNNNSKIALQYKIDYQSSLNEGEALPQILAYPNPTHSNIALNIMAEVAKVYNMHGALQLSFTNTNIVDLSTLNTGVYFVEVQSGMRIHRIKIVKY